MRFLEPLYVVLRDLFPIGRILLFIERIPAFVAFLAEKLGFLAVDAFTFARAWAGWHAAVWFIETFWPYILIAFIWLLLFSTSVIAPRWKRRHLASFAVGEIVLGVVTLATALPWPAIFDLGQYAGAMTVANGLKVAGGVFLSIRGQENLRKAAEAAA